VGAAYRGVAVGFLDYDGFTECSKEFQALGCGASCSHPRPRAEGFRRSGGKHGVHVQVAAVVFFAPPKAPKEPGGKESIIRLPEGDDAIQEGGAPRGVDRGPGHAFRVKQRAWKARRRPARRG
jgi:hypothetical protein